MRLEQQFRKRRGHLIAHEGQIKTQVLNILNGVHSIR
jgi:hypothetical protein